MQNCKVEVSGNRGVREIGQHTVNQHHVCNHPIQPNEKSTSFSGSLVLPPRGALWGGKMRDPGNEVDEKSGKALRWPKNKSIYDTGKAYLSRAYILNGA